MKKINILIEIKRFLRVNELCREWHSEDGSGFVIWIGFIKKETGSDRSWMSGEDETTCDYEGNFKWK